MCTVPLIPVDFAHDQTRHPHPHPGSIFNFKHHGDIIAQEQYAHSITIGDMDWNDAFKDGYWELRTHGVFCYTFNA